MEIEPGQYEMSFSRPNEDTLLVRLAGNWRLGGDLPPADEVQKQIESGPRIQRVAFSTEGLTDWGSGLLTFLIKVIRQCSRKKIRVEKAGLPKGAVKLIALASAVPEEKGSQKEGMREPFLSRIGESAIAFGRSVVEMLGFIGEATVAFMRLLKGKARFRRSDFTYVASLVGISMVRVMGAIMAGIIMAGRTGAAFAAQLGTMQVNEEIDALKTLGISPMEFLVLPRMLALVLMMPLLCLYADLMGILGGLIVGVGMLDLSAVEYFNQTKASVTLNHFWIGLFHSAVFGVLVALAGCLRGLQCGRSASAVGDAATSAVVTGIVSIIVATAIITIICNVLGI